MEPITRGEFTRQISLLSAGALLGMTRSDEKALDWQLGCFTRPWAGFDLRLAMDDIAAAGFKHLGLMTTAPKGGLVITLETTQDQAVKIGEEAQRRGLKIAAAYAGDFPVQESEAAGIAGLKKLIDLCAACGSRTLLLGGTGRPDLFDAYYRVVTACCPEAEAKKVQLALKPHGGLNATGPQCRGIIARVNHSAFGLWYDPGNILYYSDGQLDPVQDLESVRGVVRGVCIKDYRHPRQVDLTPGSGQVDFRRVLAGLERGGLHGGPLIIECLQPGSREELAAAARQAKKHLGEILEQLGREDGSHRSGKSQAVPRQTTEGRT